MERVDNNGGLHDKIMGVARTQSKDACLVQTFLYEIEVWGATFLSNSLNEIKQIQKESFCCYLWVKNITLYSQCLKK